jgi:hypothetical protein
MRLRQPVEGKFEQHRLRSRIGPVSFATYRSHRERRTLLDGATETTPELQAANDNFKSKLTGVWGRLLWAWIGGGLIAGALLLAGGIWLGRDW